MKLIDLLKLLKESNYSDYMFSVYCFINKEKRLIKYLLLKNYPSCLIEDLKDSRDNILEDFNVINFDFENKEIIIIERL